MHPLIPMAKLTIIVDTMFIVLLLLASGVSAAGVSGGGGGGGGPVELSANMKVIKQGSPASFFAGIRILVNEKFKVNYLTFKVYTKKGTLETCKFRTDGTMVSGCGFVKQIVPIDKEDHSKYGYHYGAKQMLYNIVIKTDNLKPGDYKSQLKANISTKNRTKEFKSKVLSFKIVKKKPCEPPKKVR
jgi:hypothetical protein